MASLVDKGPTAQVGSIPSMGNIMAWSDQIDAATREVSSAWRAFRLGPVPLGETAEADPPRQADRLGATIDTLSACVSRLQELAGVIREAV